METTNQVNDGLKEIKSSFEISTVKTNLITALGEIKTICEQREYVVEGSIDNMISDINLENSTLSSRKKLAKKIYYFQKKKSRKTMLALLSFVRKRFLGEEYRVSIKPSLLEQEIVTLRESYKKMCQETEVARLQLKEKKKLLYSKNVQA
jgi:hypothetical protein